MINWVKELGNGLFSLVYANVCQSCGDSLTSQEEWICLECNKQLQPTQFWKYEDNPVFDIFIGRVKIGKAFSFYYMENKSVIHSLLHSIKYNGKKEAAVWLGAKIGNELKACPEWDYIDLIVPVPLHFKRLKERGFNQSYFLAKGIAENFKKPICDKSVERIKYSNTQTKKGRMERIDNVENIFSVKLSNNLRNKNILLVDDVVTTGATAESCMQTILASGCKSVNFVSLAMAI